MKNMNFNIIFNKKSMIQLKKILISIFIGLLITILIIIAYSISDLGEIESDIKIDDLTSLTTKSNTDINKSVFRQEFDYFLNLFNNKKKDISVKDIKQTMSVEHQANCEDKHIKLQEWSINQGIEGSVIIKEIKDLNYEQANREIDTLNNRISLLEIQLIKYKIDRLDRINQIDSIIKDIDNEFGIKVRNRK